MKKYVSNCWKTLKTIKPKRNDETSINVKVTKVEKINCMRARSNPLLFFNGKSAAKPRTEEGSVTGAPANVKTALTTEQGQAYNFTNPAGKPVKTYQIADPSVHTDIFGIASYQFTDDTAVKVKVGNLVTVDGKGAWVASEATELETLKGTNGFVGKIHSLSVGTYYTIVRIQVLQNKDIEG